MHQLIKIENIIQIRINFFNFKYPLIKTFKKILVINIIVKI